MSSASKSIAWSAPLRRADQGWRRASIASCGSGSGSFISRAWKRSTLRQSTTGESRIIPTTASLDADDISVCSAMAPPIDQPISTMRSAP